MASITTDKPTGRRIVQFKGLDGKRRSIRLGKCSQRIAETVAAHVEMILTAAAAQSPVDQRTADWLGTISDELHAKLAAAALVHPRMGGETDQLTLGKWVHEFRQSRSHLKGGSQQGIAYALNNAVTYFGKQTALAAITPGDCDNFATWLTTKQQQSPATAGRRIRTIKALFRSAVRHELITRNPMEGVKEGSQSNPARQQFIERATIERVLDSCPDTEWRLLVSLARFGGLRIPSEAINLKWSDVDWERGRLTIHSPKTEHHAGKERRQIPLFPELRAALNDRWDVAGETEHIFDRMQRTVNQGESGWKSVNLRTQFCRILAKAGMTPWPRLWVNLRSSCETELAERFPAHVTAAWLGHTPDVARKHYLQTLDTHFATAADTPCSALQNPVHSAPEGGCFEPHPESENAKNPLKQGVSAIISCPARIRTSTK
jgi:integrase